MSEKQEPSSPRQARSRLGTTLNAKYRLDRLIGVGGMAAVYAATHRNGNRVAVKMLHGPLSLDPDIRRRFLREGYVANKVNHTGAVRVIDDDESEDGTAFLVMELLEGESLDVRWDRFARRLPVSEVLAITYELLDTLGAAHASGIVHRDLKPANVFLTVDGKLKVLDFGIARLLEATPGHAHTHTGRAVGTPAFMPPEQALGKTREIDGQTDIWALGATMFTLLSSCDVHEAENVSEQLIFAATKQARSLRLVAPEIPREVVDVVDRALAFDKSGRWAHARAMQGALAEAHLAALGQPIAESIALLSEAAGSLGAIRSESPRAFAPTVRSDRSGPALGASSASGGPPVSLASGAAGLAAPSARRDTFLENATEPSTELRASQLGSGQPTTSGGAFSLEGGASGRGTLASALATRKRSLGFGVVAAVGAILAAVTLYGYGAPRGRAMEAASGASGASGHRPLPDFVTGAPSDTPPPPAPRAPPTMVATTPQASPPPQPAVPVSSAQAGNSSAAHVKPAPSAHPHATAAAGSLGDTPKPPATLGDTPKPPGASGTAAQGGVIVAVPF